MTLFIVLALGLMALALAFVLPPLLRVSEGAGARQGKTAAALALGLPLAAATLYAALGAPVGVLSVVTPAPASAAPTEVTPAQIEAMVQRLADRLRTQPDDAAGWQRLARSYETLKRYGDAAHAYQQLERLQPADAEVLVAHAVALAMSQGQRLRGEPEALLTRALTLAPRNVQVLSLLGSAAVERGDHALAIDRWMKALDLAPPESEMARSLAASIQQAQPLAAARRP